MEAESRAVEWRWLSIDGHRLRYAVAGTGPVIVLPRKDHSAYIPFTAFPDDHTMVQVEPLGFVGSDRPDPYPPSTVADQIVAVCDEEGIDRFSVWGFSQGGAMALTVARATSRVDAVVCGGFDILRTPSAAWLARMNRERRVPLGSRTFWNDYARSDWVRVLGGLERPVLAYAGSVDKHRVAANDQRILQRVGVEIIEFPGLDHVACGLSSPASPATAAVRGWLVSRGL